MGVTTQTLGQPPAALPQAAGGALVLGKPGGGLPQIPFHPLLDAPHPRTRAPMIFGLIIFLVFVVGFGAWAGWAPLAEASVAPGVIKVEGSRRTIQHMEGGMVRELLVKDGDKVRAGDLIARLDVVQSESTAATFRAQRFALLAQDARLEAELNDRREIAFPADLAGSADPRAMEAVNGQRALFEARRANLNSQVQVLQARIEQQQAIIAGARGQLAATRQQLAFARQEEQLRRELVGKGLGRLPELLALQRAVASLQGSVEDLNGQIDRAQAGITEATKQIQSTVDQRLQEASTERRDVRAKLAEAEERLRAASDVAQRRDILAPEDGTLVNQRVFTVGAVLKPADPLFDLVPAKDRLVAEVNVQPMDIDVVYPGLQAEVRLPAFKQRLVPYLHGHVTWVAADVTTNEQTRQQYYRAYILIDQDQLAHLPSVFLTPGMPVEAHVQIGQRTFFRYMVQPLLDSFTRAFREQ
ncbi:HlyD family type I secretion periplasmic adaptor subunit [Paracraurococcus ruber]|uniref:Membrane fusion protein (MFP) family protein n=1 Tax=Paracraurococcus ruber TaxID=77675 RepID=A0ABS1CTB4_9PROT|nr:HlyD family type I secretion periplasmic adaptor subunit [Paracraurococcus ruber]MBK1657588.1 secretion protein HlyD [Paracraurococcus ruber]TDG30321.1 HlyD family type I secretion periplasmic adaptor subunit [Paracraurococcus ruber]